MTRIVGGVAKGRRLAVPARGTRPTSDRAREALFNSLAGLLDIAGARVLDLFAGSGAVGLEALSRGASAVTFVESDQRSVRGPEAQHRDRGLGAGRPAPAPGRDLSCGGRGGRTVRPGVRRSAVLLRRAATRCRCSPRSPSRSGSPTTRSWSSNGRPAVRNRNGRTRSKAIKQKRYGEGVLWYGRRR